MVENPSRAIHSCIEKLGHITADAVEELGYTFTLLCEGLFWIFAGHFVKQPLKIPSVFTQMMSVGIAAAPIVFILSFAIGIMLAIQIIYNLRIFGAESQVVAGVALSVTREFGPLITGVLVAGRTGSALAARIGTMQVNQEVDALRVMGINPVRYLVSPALLAMLVMVPTLTFFSDLTAMFGGAVYTAIETGLGFNAYAVQTIEILSISDVTQGLKKSVLFAVIIVMVGVSNGFMVKGGAEGVGKAATRAVVVSISYIVIADMLITYFLNH